MISMAATVLKFFLAVVGTAAAVAGAGRACSLSVQGQFIQPAYPAAKSAAVYLRIENPCETGDRLTGISSDAAAATELHQSKEDDQGIMSMAPVEAGMTIPPFGALLLEPGGYHGMFMGLSLPEGGEAIDITLIFEKSAPIQMKAPVRLRPR